MASKQPEDLSNAGSDRLANSCMLVVHMSQWNRGFLAQLLDKQEHEVCTAVYRMIEERAKAVTPLWSQPSVEMMTSPLTSVFGVQLRRIFVPADFGARKFEEHTQMWVMLMVQIRMIGKEQCNGVDEDERE